jgi:HlyD family secretion protein
LVVGVAVYWFVLSPVPVVQHQLERGEIIAEVMGTGTLEARVKATISPKIAGRIKEVLADQGDHVPAGKVLVRLDDEELNQQVEIAKANLAAARAAVDRLKSDKDRALAVFSQAKQNHSRAQKLVTTAAVSREEMDKATESLSVAEAGVSHAEAASIEGQRNVITAERTLEYHRARLADTVILAPFDGLIVRRQRDPGDVSVPGSPVLTLISTQEMGKRLGG